MSSPRELSLTRKISMKGIENFGLNLDDFPDDIAEALEPLDLDGDRYISKNEIVEAGRALKRVRKKNSQLKHLVLFLLLGYVILVSTIIGLVYWAVKLTKDTEVRAGSSALMTTFANEERVPVTVSSNEVALSLGLLIFLPTDVVSKIKTFVIHDEDDTQLYRDVLFMDVRPEESFSVTTTAGDKLTWGFKNSTDHMMVVTLADGTSFTKSVLCEQCSALNVLPTDPRVQAASDSLFDAFSGENDKEDHYSKLTFDCPTSTSGY